MKLTEEEKKKIISKYTDDTSDELLRYLKRRFPVSNIEFEWTKEPIKNISVDGKTYMLKGNKKYLVEKLHSMCEDTWIHLGKQKIRRTIKKYLDSLNFD